MTHIGGIHIKWYQRHIRHLDHAIDALEKGDGVSACYNAYQAVNALLSGVLGLDPYSPGPQLKTIVAMLKDVDANIPQEVLTCAEFLEKHYYEERGRECVKCAEVLTDFLHRYLNPPS